MSIQIKTVLILDEDKNLAGSNLQIVAKFTDVIVPEDESPEMTLMKLMVEKDMRTVLEDHNTKRVKVLNKAHRNRHGNEINLEPITIADVTPVIKD